MCWNFDFRALAEAMQTVQHTKHFAHPSNWAGFLLIGGNVRLSNKVALIGQALCELVKTPEKCRDALRVCLHLVGLHFVQHYSMPHQRWPPIFLYIVR